MNVATEVPINDGLSTNFTSSLFMSTLRLFKALPVKNQKKKNPSQKIVELTINNGFIFSPNVVANFSEVELRATVDIVADEFGITPEQMNSTFHKSWGKVRDAPYMQLLGEQIFHYMTTYGYKAMDVYDENTIFIPNERLDIPEVKGGVKLILNLIIKKRLQRCRPPAATT